MSDPVQWNLARSEAKLQTATLKNHNGANLNEEYLPLDVSRDETTDLTTGNGKYKMRMPFGMTLTGVKASVNTAPTGSTIIVDINKNDTSVLSTKLTIDASEETSDTAATAAVISDSKLSAGDEIAVDIDQIGSSTAGKGLKVWLVGVRTS